MNRWWGDKDESLRQASERDSRAARRYIKQIPIIQSDSEENFEDCESSLINVDGELETPVNSAPNSPVRMPAVKFEDENGADDEDYYKKLGNIRNRNFNRKEADFWFTGHNLGRI